MLQPAGTEAAEMAGSPSSAEISDDSGIDIVFLVFIFFVLIGIAIVLFVGFIKRGEKRHEDP